MLVKICGTTSVHDAVLAQDAGADFLGIIVEHPPSPRNIDLETAQAIRQAVQIPVVAVTVNLDLAQLLSLNEKLAPDALQLHGDEAPELVQQLVRRNIQVWSVIGGAAARERASTLRAAGAAAVLVDARAIASSGETVYGGTGQRSDWNLARDLALHTPVVLSGGLSPKNVSQAIEAVNPWIVDAVSGVESEPGRKDSRKVRQFVEAAKARA